MKNINSQFVHRKVLMISFVFTIMMSAVLFAQVAMEIYAYTFIAEKNVETKAIVTQMRQTQWNITMEGHQKKNVREEQAQTDRQKSRKKKIEQEKTNRDTQQEKTNRDTQQKRTETDRQKTTDVKTAPSAKRANTSMVFFVKPIKGGVTSSGFGDMVSRTAMHKGHDWAVAVGTKVMAAADGVVEKAYYSDSYGYNVLVRHADGFETRYAHMSKLYVMAGEKVSQKQRLGLSGTTGQSTGPHLHFEVIKNGTFVNPLDYIK